MSKYNISKSVIATDNIGSGSTPPLTLPSDVLCFTKDDIVKFGFSVDDKGTNVAVIVLNVNVKFDSGISEKYIVNNTYIINAFFDGSMTNATSGCLKLLWNYNYSTATIVSKSRFDDFDASLKNEVDSNPLDISKIQEFELLMFKPE